MGTEVLMTTKVLGIPIRETVVKKGDVVSIYSRRGRDLFDLSFPSSLSPGANTKAEQRIARFAGKKSLVDTTSSGHDLPARRVDVEVGSGLVTTHTLYSYHRTTPALLGRHDPWTIGPEVQVHSGPKIDKVKGRRWGVTRVFKYSPTSK